MRKKILLAISIIVLIILAGICAAVLSNNASKLALEETSKLTLEEAESMLLEHLADDPIIEYVYIEPYNSGEQEINVYDGQESCFENAYTFGSFYNENMPGLEGRSAGDYAISLDGKKVYWYDSAKDWFIDYDSKLTYEEAESMLLEHLADDPDIGYVYIEHNNPNVQVIYINDRQAFRYESVYNFSFRYNENMPGLEDRSAGDYAISLDGKKVYWYDSANDWYIDNDDLRTYNPGAGEWTE